MIHEHKETRMVTITKRICDDCGKEIKRNLVCNVARCEICGIDLCDKCVYHEDATSGDYRIVYCKKCWNIGEQFRVKIKLHRSKIESLYEEWYSICNKKEMKNETT